MPKPTLTGRVPQDLKDNIDEFAEEYDLSQSDAMRRLLRSGIEAERGLAADGGVEERVAELDRRQRRQQRTEQAQAILLGLTIIIGTAVLTGAVSGALALAAAAVLGVALIASSLYPLRGDRDE